MTLTYPRTLLRQCEARRQHGPAGVRYGIELFVDDKYGIYEGYLHARTYKGDQVESKWRSGVLWLDGDDEDEAWDELSTIASEFIMDTWPDEYAPTEEQD